ncbi:MAG: GDSL-type esterase/lipase family protein, partial [Verrucomicrobiota bacterium]
YLGHSYVFMVAGRLGIELAEAQLDFYNRGISGNTVEQLKARWQEDVIDMHPDILTVLIGTNDVGKKVSPESFEADYRAILQSSRDANPKLKIVLLDPFVLKSGGLKNEQAWQARRSATDQLRVVVARLAEEFDAVHIETQALFDEATQSAPADYWLWDGIHPLPQGHELIARHWVKATAARWPVAFGQSVRALGGDLDRDGPKWLLCSTGQVGTTDRPEQIGMSVDGNVGTKWCVPHEGRPVEWLVKLEEPIAVKEYQFTSANDVPVRDPREWKWEGSMDRKTWVQLDYREQQDSFPERQQEKSFAFENSSSYRYCRLTLLTNQGDGLFQLSEIALSGVSIDPTYVINNVVRPGN